ncbi:uncharacterized protein BJ171DRAFT_568036 [Polychytrium aggregatum]|uniref:uncharacterized protein n=1 Tax=Polychytrium aggregatum TaxID=110093 RepID=UPI0022FE38BC|nr:uncharacterized protein BJ171DRAFT_568036 [Polychytrium aggregatum]KAI9204634.1 hypothetical protein BJ171DRAFT_568036 [Polychytrium aggregatum]
MAAEVYLANSFLKYIQPYIPESWTFENAYNLAVAITPEPVKHGIADLLSRYLPFSDIVIASLAAAYCLYNFGFPLRRPNRQWIYFAAVMWVLAIAAMFYLQTLIFGIQKYNYDNALRQQGVEPDDDTNARFEPLVVPDLRYQFNGKDLFAFLQNSGAIGRRLYISYLIVEVVYIMAYGLINRHVLSFFYPYGDSSSIYPAMANVCLVLADFYENSGLIYMAASFPANLQGNVHYAARISRVGASKFPLAVLVLGLIASGLIRYWLGMIDYEASKKAIAERDAHDLLEQERESEQQLQKIRKQVEKETNQRLKEVESKRKAVKDTKKASDDK